MERILTTHYYALCLVLEKGGLIELIAPNFASFSIFLHALNTLLRFRKHLSTLKDKLYKAVG
jgi:hypothetical protein